jgi:hypothetical protein
VLRVIARMAHAAAGAAPAREKRVLMREAP